MLNKRLEVIFIFIIVIAIAVLASNYYKDYVFKNSDISSSYKKLISDKELEILSNMQNNFGFTYKVPLIITDKFKGRLYGLTSYANGKTTIYLNKKVMQESMDYIVNNVIAHEYAHALMFKLGRVHTKKDGHSLEWRETCIKLGGEDCQQYVNSQEIIMSKMPFK